MRIAKLPNKSRYDASMGLGKVADSIPLPEHPKLQIGYAGGMGPANLGYTNTMSANLL